MRLRIGQRSIALGSAVVALLLPVAVSAGGGWYNRVNEVRVSISNGTAKNVILLIGDGMGDSEITIARNYGVGAGGRLALDKLPLTGAMTTYSVQEADPSKPDYTSESASTASAWSTGQKTADGRISTSAGTDQDLTTILELAQKNQLRTGIVSTAEITDATPAAPSSHVNARACQGPADMAACPQDNKSAGGPGSIAEQQVDHGIDVILGGGKRRYDQVITGGSDSGKTVIQSAERQGYTFVGDAAGLSTVQPGQKVLGLFNSGNMSLEWTGEPALPEPGSGSQRCQENQRPANEPSLAEMTSKAIELLKNNRGFFLQVEGASIDKQDHAAAPCQQIGETLAFDKAVQVALDFLKKNRDTLVIVTADHAHTSQIVEVDSKSPGLVSTLITNEGVPMKINYGTAPLGASQGHTGSQVRVAAAGRRAANVVGVIDQTELFYIMKNVLQLK